MGANTTDVAGGTPQRRKHQRSQQWAVNAAHPSPSERPAVGSRRQCCPHQESQGPVSPCPEWSGERHLQPCPVKRDIELEKAQFWYTEDLDFRFCLFNFLVRREKK